MIGKAIGTVGRGLFGGKKLVKELPKVPGHKWEYKEGLFSRTLNSGWQIDALRSFGNSFLPSVAIVAEVDVFGSPFSGKKELYFLALSIAFGIVDFAMTDLADNTIEAMIDHTGKHVRVKFTQAYSGAAGNADAVKKQDLLSGARMMRQGPKSSIYSGVWPHFISADNRDERLADLKKLPAANTLMITQGIAANYQPYYDNGSTEADLVDLITAAILSGGCSDPTRETLQEMIANKIPVAPVIPDPDDGPNPLANRPPTTPPRTLAPKRPPI